MTHVLLINLFFFLTKRKKENKKISFVKKKKMNLCHRENCIRESKFECQGCKESKFPSLRYCSDECARILLPRHNELWHSTEEVKYILNAIPLIEVRISKYRSLK